MSSICCLKRTDIPQEWLPQKGSLSATDQLLSDLDACPIHWKARKQVEQDSSFKQCIPYALIEKNGKIACYPRTGTEIRLHALHSCGFGGHVEKTDDRSRLTNTLRHSLQREIMEECELDISREQLQFMGLINEEMTAVGQVHLGFAYCFSMNQQQTLHTTEEITSIQWMDPHNDSLKLEHWSKLAIELYLETR